MGVNNIKIKNFTLFNDFEAEFSNGINIFIGENGTGKTHLLKLIYSMLNVKNNNLVLTISKYFQKEKGIEDLSESGKDTTLELESDSFEVKKESDYFCQHIIHCPTPQNPQNVLEITHGDNSKFHFSYAKNIEKSIFIPAKDILTHSEGFLSLCNKFNMPFDKTYYDLINNCLLPKLNAPSKLANEIAPLLENMMEGKVVTENDVFYIEKKNGKRVNFSVEAEGYKKIALLWQLIMTENLTEGTILLWDEPEANLNPKFIPDLVEIILALQRNGVQVFLSTHSYIFAKYFEVRRKKYDMLLFHSLYRENDNVICESNNSFKDLKHNMIMDSFEQLLDEVYNDTKEE